MVYEWKAQIYKVDPQEAGEYLDGLAKRDGGLDPSTIVREAESPKAVLHPCFEWDDSQAAQKFREVQARMVIRNLVRVHVVKEDDEEKPLRTRAFIHVTTEEREIPKYVDIEIALTSVTQCGASC